MKMKYGYLYATLGLFLFSLLGHWLFAWFAYVDEQQEHSQPVEVRGYLIETGRDTLENWQSEFLQLIWQVVGLAFLWYVGSPQSKENSDRTEEKIDYLLERIDPKNAKAVLKRLEQKYPKK